MVYFVAKNIGMFGGAAVVAMDAVDSLLKSDIEIEAICSEYSIPETGYERLSSLKRRKMPYVPEREDYSSGAVGGTLRYLLKNTQSMLERAALNLHLYRTPPDLMIFNGFKPSTMAVINRYSGLCKTIHIVHVSPHYVDDFEDFITLQELLNVYSKADSLVFVSDQCRKAWLQYDGIDKEKAYYIPNCAREDEAMRYLEASKSETREKLGFKSDSFYLVNVASVKERKGQDLLIEAAPELRKIAPNLEIIIIGSKGGHYASELEEAVARKQMDFVKFIGRKSNAMEYIYASDLFVLPSRAEALPLVLLESMILKTPMIGSDVDGVREMIDHKSTGLLFESDNVEELIQRFKEMYTNPDARRQYSEEASAKYRSDFSKEEFTKRYTALIKQVLDK